MVFSPVSAPCSLRRHGSTTTGVVGRQGAIGEVATMIVGSFGAELAAIAAGPAVTVMRSQRREGWVPSIVAMTAATPSWMWSRSIGSSSGAADATRRSRWRRSANGVPSTTLIASNTPAPVSPLSSGRIAGALAIVGLLSLLFGCGSKSSPFTKVDGVWHYNQTPVPNADAKTFAPVDDHYAKDRVRVYWADTYRDGKEYFTVRHDRIAQDLRDARQRHPRAPHVLRLGEARDGPGLEAWRLPRVGAFASLDGDDAAALDAHLHELGAIRTRWIVHVGEAAERDGDLVAVPCVRARRSHAGLAIIARLEMAA